MTRLLLLAALAPAAMFATSQGGPIRAAGVPVDDGGQTCVQCHTSFPLNSPGGRVTIQAFHYRPGQRQNLRVTVSHPEARKWGFQITARRASDLTQKAGRFVVPAGIRLRCDEPGNPAGRDATPENPCRQNETEFAGHSPTVVFGGENGTKTFELEWVAPDADVGNVVFYAVGNAANNSGTNQGDRIYSDHLEIEAEGRACPNTIRPTLQLVTSAATGRVRDVAMNSMISVWGMNFSAVKREAYRADFRNGYPKELGCVAVEIGGQRAPISYVQNDQINAQVPTLAATGPVPVKVILNPGRPNELVSDTGTLNIVPHSPAFFTFGTGGHVAAVFPDGTIASDPAVVQGARRMRGGDVVQLFATGLGPTEGDWAAGEMPDRASPTRDRVTVTVGGITIPQEDVLYVGLSPFSISALYQINVRLPARLEDGEVPISISVGGVRSPDGTVLAVRNQ